MKKLFAALAVGICAAFAFAAGCATLNTPAKVAAALCPPTQTAINDFTDFSKLYPALPAIQTGDAILTEYQPVVDAVCAEGATVTSTSLQNLISQGIPAVAAIVATVPMPVATQTAIQAGFRCCRAGSRAGRVCTRTRSSRPRRLQKSLQALQPIRSFSRPR